MKKIFSIFVPPEGNFDIDAGDGGGGDHLGPKIPSNHKKPQTNLSYENCSHFCDCSIFYLKKSLNHVPIYSQTCSESDIQNIILLYKTHPKCQNTFSENTTNRENEKHCFSKQKNAFKFISVLWRFVWPAFGVTKILVYIYIYIYTHLLLQIPK